MGRWTHISWAECKERLRVCSGAHLRKQIGVLYNLSGAAVVEDDELDAKLHEDLEYSAMRALTDTSPQRLLVVPLQSWK